MKSIGSYNCRKAPELLTRIFVMQRTATKRKYCQRGLPVYIHDTPCIWDETLSCAYESEVFPKMGAKIVNYKAKAPVFEIKESFDYGKMFCSYVRSAVSHHMSFMYTLLPAYCIGATEIYWYSPVISFLIAVDRDVMFVSIHKQRARTSSAWTLHLILK